jgi:metal-responsive CopG/Arc/MetJ family transcriptional regulator
MSTLSFRLSDTVLKEAEARAQSLHISRNEYIRRAIEKMNRETLRLSKREKLKKASALVRQESLTINEEFAKIENDPLS